MKRFRSGKGSTQAAPTSSSAHHPSRQPSTPILFNQNSNSCSNDTNLSTFSSASLNPEECQIAIKESKIRSLLKELQADVKKCQQERDDGLNNLTSLNKMHERLRKEDKITQTIHKKLKSVYTATSKDTENEIKCLRKALECISQIRLIQNEIRLIQHSSNTHTASPSNLTNGATAGIKKANTTMRRGVLMSLLHQAALTLPLWIGDHVDSAPPLCGRIPPEPHYACKPGDKVAAIVKSGGPNTTLVSKKGKGAAVATTQAEDELQDEDEENWILAEVVSFNSNTCKYEVDDIDAEDGLERHLLGKRRIVPLPLWRANPLTDPEAVFPKDSIVLALYPQTTCFYRGLVYEAPQTHHDDYLILFEDNTYPEGYSPPLNVPQLYVVANKTFNKK